jgi:hypothetical protein
MLTTQSHKPYIEFKVKSKNSKKVYSVKYFQKVNIWRCDCPYFMFKGSEKNPCKHILQVVKKKSK